MKLTIIRENDYVKGTNILCTPIESLHIHSALLCYSENAENEIDRKEAKRMCDEFLLASAEATGKQECVEWAYEVIASNEENE